MKSKRCRPIAFWGTPRFLILNIPVRWKSWKSYVCHCMPFPSANCELSKQAKQRACFLSTCSKFIDTKRSFVRCCILFSLFKVENKNFFFFWLISKNKGYLISVFWKYSFYIKKSINIYIHIYIWKIKRLL